MIPLFKTCYSLGGRSILTLEDESDETGPRSVFDLAKEADLKEIFLVEDTMTGFLKAYKNCAKAGIPLRFGLRISCVTDLKSEDAKKTLHKIVLMAKNTDGLTSLNKISSKANLEFGGMVDFNLIKNYWDGLYLVIPYYDSFLMNNLLTLKTCIPDIEWTQPVFFKERNGLPFESIINKGLEVFKNYEQVNVKSIYYENKADFLAWQTFKCMSRKSYKSSTLENPGMEHCCSNEFCIESWKENGYSNN
jgi:DNA polymerase III alpha subunit